MQNKRDEEAAGRLPESIVDILNEPNPVGGGVGGHLQLLVENYWHSPSLFGCSNTFCCWGFPPPCFREKRPFLTLLLKKNLILLFLIDRVKPNTTKRNKKEITRQRYPRKVAGVVVLALVQKAKNTTKRPTPRIPLSYGSLRFLLTVQFIYGFLEFLMCGF